MNNKLREFLMKTAIFFGTGLIIGLFFFFILTPYNAKTWLPIVTTVGREYIQLLVAIFGL